MGSESLAHPHQDPAGCRWWKFMGVFMFCEAGNGYQIQRHSPQRLAKRLPKWGDHTVMWGLWGVMPSSLKDALVS